MSRDHDLVLLGATGFAGRLTAAHLARHAPDGLRVALAGRSRQRLEAARAGLPPRAHDWPLLVVDSADRPGLDALAASSRVVVTTVGPYARHGLPLVRACAAAGTHYADLTGEVLFVRASIDAAHAQAQATGARIVHACGFDSVPSELGVLLAHEAAGEPLTSASLVLLSARGGVSGGTVDSLRLQVDTARRDGAARRLLADPYALSPDRAAEPDLGRQGDVVPTGRVDGRWVAPFVMAPFNTRIVRRSNALLGYGYGPRLRYREVMAVPGGPVGGLTVTAGLGAFLAGLSVPPVRAVLDRVLPSPGAGPGERARERGHFTTRTVCTTAAGRVLRTTVAGTGDPGYAATAVMLGESGLALALDDLPDAAGVLTPATGLGSGLAGRLRAHGWTVQVA